MPCNSKTAGRRAKRLEIWDSALVEQIWDTFDFLLFKVTWWLFGALVLNDLNSQWLSV